MATFLMEGRQTPSAFKRARLNLGEGAQDERWLQSKHFTSPELVVIDRMDALLEGLRLLFASHREGGLRAFHVLFRHLVPRQR